MNRWPCGPSPIVTTLSRPHFSTYARAEAEAILNDLGLPGARLMTRGGLRIYTTLDVDLQLQAECTARSQVMRLDGSDPVVTPNTTAGTPCAAAELPARPCRRTWSAWTAKSPTRRWS